MNPQKHTVSVLAQITSWIPDRIIENLAQAHKIQTPTLETTVVCQGCENECEVSIAFRDGKPVCLGGNNCPTGETYALSQVEKTQWKTDTKY